MNKTTKLALAFATFAALATTASAAEPKWRHGYDGPRQGMMDGRRGDMRGGQRGGMDREQMFDRADADDSGDVTYEEFAAAFGGRFTSADADKNGELTVGEVADGIQRMMAERMAARVIERFDANSYLYLTKAMDYFDLAARYGSLEGALAKTTARILITSYTTDWLFPTSQIRELVSSLIALGRHATFCELESPYGHDSFLIEIDQLSELVRAFLQPR